MSGSMATEPDQQGSLFGLGEVGPLLDALRDSITAVRIGALRALVRLPLDKEAWFQVGGLVWRELSNLLAGRGSDPEAETAVPARELVEAAVYVPFMEIRRLLHELVEGGSERERHIAAHALARARDASALPQLVADLSSAEPYLRIEAAASLSYLDVTPVQGELSGICLHDAEGDVRFWLSLALGRLGDTEGIERLLRDLDEGTAEITLLWGDPTVLADRVSDRGPFPETFGQAMARLCQDDRLSDHARQIAADLRIGLALPLPDQAPGEPEPEEPERAEDDAGLEERARAVAAAYTARSPFSEGHGILWDEALALAHLDADTARSLVSKLFADVVTSLSSGQRVAGGNEIMQLPGELWHAFEPDIPVLAKLYVDLDEEERAFRSQLAWAVSRAGLQRVLGTLGPRLAEADEAERAAIVGLIEEVILYSPYDHGPVFGGGGAPADLRPPGPDSLLEFGVREAAIGPRGEPPMAEPPKRYANAALMDEAVEGVLERDKPLVAGQAICLRLDIGPLSDESGVINPEAIPVHLLPRTDLWLEVMVSSTRFAVSESRLNLDQPGIARGRFFLPRDGSPAQTSNGERWLYFWLRAPEENGQARARVGYYYKAHLVQSQLLSADVGPREGGWQVEIDYTLSESLVDLEALPERRQVSIVTNDNGDGSHQIIVRAADGAGAPLAEPCTYELDSDTVGGLVGDLRSSLASRSPSRVERRKRDLIQDLLSLAPLGHRLFHAVVGPHVQEVYTPLIEHADTVIQVTRPTSAGYVFPWGLMYEITLELDDRGRLDRNAAQICPVVDAWDEVSAMVAQGLHQCPAVDDGMHEANTLCPFGFWGYRYPIEQLSSTSSPVREIRVPAGDRFEVAAAQTQYGVDLDALAAHIADLRDRLQRRFPAADIAEGKDRAQIRTLLGQDLPAVYFYCHGERPVAGSPETYLGVGQRDRITAMDFQNWVKDWLLQDRKRVWDRVRPLIFINACHSVEISPDTLVSYLDAFVGAAHAAGVIGTEVRINQRLAMDVATQFFERFFRGETVDRALHAVRLDLLAHGNLFGLAYTPYCWTDLHVIAT